MMENPCAELDQLIARGLTYTWREVKNLTGVRECVAENLAKSREDEDWDRFADYAEAASYHPSSASTAMICEVLGKFHEDIGGAMLYYEEALVGPLVRLADPSTIPTLTDVLWSGRPAWDLALAKSCVDALCEIGTPEAMAQVRRAAMLHLYEVRGHAVEEFDFLAGDEFKVQLLGTWVAERRHVNVSRGDHGEIPLSVDAVMVDPSGSRWLDPLADLLWKVRTLGVDVDVDLALQVVFAIPDHRWPHPISEVTTGVLSEAHDYSTLVLGVPLSQDPPGDADRLLKNLLELALEEAGEVLLGRSGRRLSKIHHQVVEQL